MHYYEVAPTKIFRAGADILTYESDQKLPPGTTVLISLGKKTVPGLITKSTQKPTFPTKPITKILYDQPIPQHLLQSLLWLSQYYACPLPTVLQSALPRGIEKARRAKAESPSDNSSERSVSPVKKSDLQGVHHQKCDAEFEQSAFGSLANPEKTLPEAGFLCDRAPRSQKRSAQIPLNPAQLRAISEINFCKTTTALLHGITGSGKTNIYLELARQTLSIGRSTILLVPEIALTSQLIQNFKAHFNHIALLHSKQTESTRHLLWESILTNSRPQIIIGPRSALFAPVKNLGLIIIDEAHEPTYHQDQAPKYSALRLASKMTSFARLDEVQGRNEQRKRNVFDIRRARSGVSDDEIRQTNKTLLGTATPTITDYYLAKQQNAIITLDQLAVKTQVTTNLQIIDLKDHANFKKHRLFSDQLLASIQDSLKTKTQTMIFHNRRGSAPLTICDHCGWQALCPLCLLPLNLHADQYALQCHACGLRQPVPTACPTCQHANILHKGFGTKLIEAELRKLFPHVRIARFDADTETEKSLHLIYDQVKSGHIDIIIGTQMIAKGFDLPKLTTLGVVQADASLSLPDFSSEERTFQLLTQVIGRANRGHQNSHIIIQTFQPDHPVIKFGTKTNYQNFYQYLIKNRHTSALPPYSYLLKLAMTYKTENACIRNIQKLREEIENLQKSFSRDYSPARTVTSIPDATDGFAQRAVPSARQRMTSPAESGSRKKDFCKFSISSPTPAFHERTPQGFTWQLIVKSKSRQPLLSLIKNLPPNPHLRFHLDPPTLL